MIHEAFLYLPSLCVTVAGFVIQIKKAVAKLKDDVAHLNLEVALLVSGIDREIVRKITNTMETSRDY